MSMTDVGDLTEDTHARQVMDDCLAAYKACTETASYCVQEGGALADPHLLQRLHDCADIALTTVNFLSRASRFHRQVAAVCADVAEACAEELVERAPADDAQIRVTHAACLRVHRSCAELTGVEPTPSEDARDEALRETFPGSDAPPPPTEL